MRTKDSFPGQKKLYFTFKNRDNEQQQRVTVVYYMININAAHLMVLYRHDPMNDKLVVS